MFHERMFLFLIIQKFFQMEFQTKALDRLKTIKTGKRKILDIFRQNANVRYLLLNIRR